MANDNSPIKQYMALALQPVMVGPKERSEITRNLDHIAELAFAAKNVTEIELPVRLYTIPEGALQGFTDEIFDWDHVDYIDRLAIDIPGKETEYLGQLARGLDAFIIALEMMLAPDADLDALGAAGRTFVESWASPSAVAESYRELLADI